MPSRRSVPLPTREQLDRVRESLIRSAERQHRINDIMTQLAGAVGPSIADLGARGSSYLAGETSLLSGDFGFFASPPMLWWKGILWAHDPAWIYRHPRQRIAT
ncbi:MAG TPA: hypothetical protein VGS57_22340, partial [Thermoanaerobaculia bacterium]|nr:hypothetical protein [Thermoanaerobaculia bacterium]